MPLEAGDKILNNTFMYIPNDDTQNYHICRLQFVVETFEHSTQRTNQSKFINSPKDNE